MSRLRNVIPSYRLHKPTGHAIVVLPLADGKRRTIYLGRFGSKESKAHYRRIIAEIDQAPVAESQPVILTPVQRAASPSKSASSGLTIAEMILRFWQHANQYYVRPDGKPGSELADYSASLRYVRELYDDAPASSFGPLSLKAVRDKMIVAGLCRKIVNQRIGRVKAVFKWAASEELIPANVFHGLQTVAGLRKGKSKAIEYPRVAPVADDVFHATLPHCPPAIATMLRVMRLTGMRPGELIIMRPMDLDTSEEVWKYTPSTHKTANIGRERVVFIGPQAKLTITPYLTDCPVDECVFSPIRERTKRLAALRAKRKTRVQPSQRDRSKVKPKRLPGTQYIRNSINYAVAKACRAAGVPHWFPYQLRHTFATEARKRYGLEAAQVLLGHSQAAVTQIYAERDHDKARAVAALAG